MKITVKFFGSFRQRFSREPVELELPEGSCAGDVVAPIGERFPEFSRLGFKPLLAVNDTFERATKPLADGDCVNLFPPVHGGAPAR
ncbi:MAG: MoaD/ThiS family protein [Acidobacteriota bacterium]